MIDTWNTNVAQLKRLKARLTSKKQTSLGKLIVKPSMQSLVDDMVQADLKQRPTMDGVVKRFADISGDFPGGSASEKGRRLCHE